MTRHRSRGPAAERGGADAAVPPPPAPSWPRALRAIRAWLSPWIALQRWWPAWSKAPPPPQLQALISSVAAGYGLHLYIPNYRTTDSWSEFSGLPNVPSGEWIVRPI